MDSLQEILHHSNNLLKIFELHIYNKNIILIGEDHYEMNKILDTTKSNIITNIIIDYAKSNNSEILIEYEQTNNNSDIEIWNNFIEKNELLYEIDEEYFINNSIIENICSKNLDFIFKLDNRLEILSFDDVFNSNFMNVIMNYFGFIGENEEQNQNIKSTIINLVETVIIRKVIIYLIKRQKDFTTDSIIFHYYESMINNIKINYKKFINFVKSYNNNDNMENTEKMVTFVVYQTPAYIIDLNIIEKILVSTNNNFVVYTGIAHSINLCKLFNP